MEIALQKHGEQQTTDVSALSRAVKECQKFSSIILATFRRLFWQLGVRCSIFSSLRAFRYKSQIFICTYLLAMSLIICHATLHTIVSTIYMSCLVVKTQVV